LQSAAICCFFYNLLLLPFHNLLLLPLRLLLQLRIVMIQLRCWRPKALSLLAGSRTSKKSTYVCLLPTRFVMEWTTQFPIHNIRRFLGSHEGEIPRQEHDLNHLHLPSVAMRKRPVFGSESGEEIIQSRPAFINTSRRQVQTAITARADGGTFS
jgi:hypothetical protein